MSAETLYSKYKYIWAQQHNTMDSLFAYIQQHPVIKMDSYGNITVKNIKDDTPLPVFCCHLDTVHGDVPEPELLGVDVLTSFNGHGIGGDDKCGIVACLELLDRVPCKAIFFRDEEKGCLGSKEFDVEEIKNDLFCIEIDRRNACDLIIKTGGTKMCSDEFVRRIKESLPHCKPANGLYTDVSRLGEAEINMLNISSGYYNPHSEKEYVVLSELKRNIDGLADFAQSIIKKPLEKREYKRDETTGYYSTGNWWTNKRKHQDDLYGSESAGEDDYYACQYGTGLNNSSRDDESSATLPFDDSGNKRGSKTNEQEAIEYLYKKGNKGS